jgi:four helix bundle protein
MQKWNAVGVRRYTDLVVWQLAEEFKRNTFGLVRSSAQARRNFRFVDQIESAAGGPSKHITEGFLRFAPLEFARFLDYAISSVGETEGWLRDGIARGFFAEADCATQFALAKRLSKGITRLKATQLRYAAELEARKKQAKAGKLREPDEEN